MEYRTVLAVLARAPEAERVWPSTEGVPNGSRRCGTRLEGRGEYRSVLAVLAHAEYERVLSGRFRRACIPRTRR